MKTISVNVQITKCPKQFEAVRLGLEATLDPNETVEVAIKAATAQLNSIYEEMYCAKPKAPQTAQKTVTNTKEVPEQNATKNEQPKREKLTFEDPRLKQAIARIEKNPEKANEVVDNMHKYFELDEQAEKVLQAAARLNNKIQ